MTRHVAAFVLTAVVWTSAPPSAAAYASLQVESGDSPGEGFNDPTAVAPVGGNTGTTLGEQRMIAVQHAADLWGAALSSGVPIVVHATFDTLACTGSATTLATASAAGLLQGIDSNGANPALGYPDALANRLLGSDFAPGEPDIVATFNSAVDAGCLAGTQWYYGLDAQHGDGQDLVNVALHELGHGLGVQAFVDAGTGQHALGFPSAYSSHVLDLDSTKHWTDMTDAERKASYTNARRVVWDGSAASQAAAEWLLAGRPEIQVSPSVPSFTGLASDASYGGPLATSVSAPLVTSASGCPGAVAGGIALLLDSCATSAAAATAETAGAVGALVSVPTVWSSPPAPADEAAPVSVGIPVLAVSPDDAGRLYAAAQLGTVTVSLSFAPGLRGADGQGHVLLNATQPSDTGSSISHWDELARPDLLMEALQKDVARHDLDITPAMLLDLGWVPLCGDGDLDQDEACDDGGDNSDSTPDACRTNCEMPFCGDGVRDSGEACDDGDDNSDTAPDACRASCDLARCGDGVRDSGETCDDGDDNSDTAPDACRTNCERDTPYCGDGVRDSDESCDDGDDNSDITPDACRTSCEPARCGDGVRDSGEACDDGDDNSDTTPDACRTSCEPARCGDGVRDSGEACDDGDDNSDTTPDACRTSCEPARCGDGVRDSDEGCDDGEDNSDTTPDACRTRCELPRCGDGVVDQPERCDRGPGFNCTTDCTAEVVDAGAQVDDAPPPPPPPSSPAVSDGCGCRLAVRRSSPLGVALWLAACALRLRRRLR